MTGAISYGLSLLAPAALLPGLGVKLLALAVFPLLLWLSGFFGATRRVQGSLGRA